MKAVCLSVVVKEACCRVRHEREWGGATYADGCRGETLTAMQTMYMTHAAATMFQSTGRGHLKAIKRRRAHAKKTVYTPGAWGARGGAERETGQGRAKHAGQTGT